MLMLMFRVLVSVVSVSARRAEGRATAAQGVAEKAQDSLREAETEVERAGATNVSRAIMVASRLPALKAEADRLLGAWDRRSARAASLTSRAERLAGAKGRWVPYLAAKFETGLICLTVIWLPTVVDISRLCQDVLEAFGHGAVTE